MDGLKLKYAVVFVPLVLGIAYMYLHEDLSATATILIACLLFTAVMMFFVFKVSEADLKATEKKGEDKIDRSMFKVHYQLLACLWCA
jgi:4-hydroxybenzoate polyprenyltransferase